MQSQLSFLTSDENKRLRILMIQRLEFIRKQLELFNTKYPRSSGSEIIINAYQKEEKELLSIQRKLIGGDHIG